MKFSIKTASVLLASGIILNGCGNSNVSHIYNPVKNENVNQPVDNTFEALPEVNQNSYNLILSKTAQKAKRLSSQEIILNLKKAAAGLLMPSESDYPFKTFTWIAQASATPLTKEKVLKLTNRPLKTVVEITSSDYFFRNVTQFHSGQTPEEKETAIKFRNLYNVLKTSLEDIQVFRLGSVEIDVYIVGKNKTSNDYLGLSTKLIETRKIKL